MKLRVSVTQEVEVELNEEKFTAEFMAEFAEYFYPLQSIEQHAGHIAQLKARHLLQSFTEGYGFIEEMGISAKLNGLETEVHNLEF